MTYTLTTRFITVNDQATLAAALNPPWPVMPSPFPAFEGRSRCCSSPDVYERWPQNSTHAEASGFHPQPTCDQFTRNVEEALANAGRSATDAFIRTTSSPQQIVRASLGRVGFSYVGRPPAGCTACCESSKDDALGLRSRSLDSPRPCSWRDDAQLPVSACRVISSDRSFSGEPAGFIAPPASAPARLENFLPKGLTAFSRSPACTCPGSPSRHADHTFYVWVRCRWVHTPCLSQHPADLRSPITRVGQPCTDRQGHPRFHAGYFARHAALGGLEPPQQVWHGFRTREARRWLKIIGQLLDSNRAF